MICDVYIFFYDIYVCYWLDDDVFGYWMRKVVFILCLIVC